MLSFGDSGTCPAEAERCAAKAGPGRRSPRLMGLGFLPTCALLLLLCPLAAHAATHAHRLAPGAVAPAGLWGPATAGPWAPAAAGRGPPAEAGDRTLAQTRKGAQAPAQAQETAPAPKAVLSQAQIVEQTNITRIQEAFEAMQEQFYTPTTGLYVGEPVGYSFLWPFSQALAATISLDEIPSLKATYTNEVGARLTGLQLYWDTDNSEEPEGTFASTLPAYDASSAPPTGPGGTKFYDDNEWVGLELVRVYKLLGDAAALEQAKQILAFVEGGGRRTLRCPAQGGSCTPTRPPTATGTSSLTVPRPSSRPSCTPSPRKNRTSRFAEATYNWHVPACCSRTTSMPTTSGPRASSR